MEKTKIRPILNDKIVQICRISHIISDIFRILGIPYIAISLFLIFVDGIWQPAAFIVPLGFIFVLAEVLKCIALQKLHYRSITNQDLELLKKIPWCYKEIYVGYRYWIDVLLVHSPVAASEEMRLRAQYSSIDDIPRIGDSVMIPDEDKILEDLILGPFRGYKVESIMLKWRGEDELYLDIELKEVPPKEYQK